MKFDEKSLSAIPDRQKSSMQASGFGSIESQWEGRRSLFGISLFLFVSNGKVLLTVKINAVDTELDWDQIEDGLLD